MAILGVWWKRLALALLLATVLAPARAQGQQLAGAAQGPASLPPPPPQGAWGEVIMANNRWMVIQNNSGQQFPIANDAIGQFLIRWPSRLEALTPQTVIEAIGPDVGNNTVLAEHVDTFVGADQNLVTPGATSLLPNNRPVTTIDPGFQRYMNAFDIGSQNLLHGWAYPVSPGVAGIPAQLHVVGPVVQLNPAIRIGIPGNNFATIQPSAGSMTVTRVTRGNTSFAQKGDLAFLAPTSLTPRTVVLSQVVLYKKIAVEQFRAP